MKLERFALERLQSVWENRVEWNVSESGVQPLRVEDLVDDPALMRELLAQNLGYPQTNGTSELRGLIAAMYPGATPDHVLVTNGGSEANCVALLHLVESGDEVLMMTPNYMQVAGLARALGATLLGWPLRPGSRWQPDLEALERLVTERTRLIIICNPNNPTGRG
jgi:aspartate/methionine/tyrosine aminotransferase